MTTWEIICDDIIHWAAEYQGKPFAAILCDPPYHLTGGFMSKDWDKDGPEAISFRPETWAALAEHLLPGGFIFAFASSRGWHRLACALEDSGLIIQPSIFNWQTREVAEVPFCLGWLNSQSFPKATRIDTQLDSHGGQSVGWFGPWLRKWREEHGITQKALAKHFPSKTGGLTGCVANWELGHNLPTVEQFNKLVEVLELPFETIEEAERDVVGKGTSGKTAIWNEQGEMGDFNITAPATDLARAWEGHRYGGQILKNALEPIIVAQKPWVGKRLDCIVETGAGSLWVDGGRIGVNSNDPNHRQPSVPFHKGGNEIYGDGLSGRPIENLKSQGRWPANFVLCHSEGCERVGVKRVKGSHSMGNCEGKDYGPKDSPIYQNEIGKLAGHDHVDPDGYERVDDFLCDKNCPIARLDEQAGNCPSKQGGRLGKWIEGPFSNTRRDYSKEGMIRDDSGGPSRFYYNADWSHEVAERIAGTDPVHYCPKSSKRERNAGLDLSVERELGHNRFDTCAKCGGYILQNPERPSACKCEEPERQHNKVKGNHHPCCKPISLCKHLATLLLPPKEYAPRRLLIPFCGTMSEGIGALLAGWDKIVGIDSEQDYCDIGEARMKFWSVKSQETGSSDPKAILKKGKKNPHQDKLL